MAYLVMERTFEEPLTDEELDRMMTRLNPCLEQYDVRWIRSYLSSTRRRMICAFEAPDAEAVRIAYRTAGLPFESVWPADEVRPEREEA